MEVFFTVLAGTLTFVLGQIAVGIVIRPVQEFKVKVSEISHYLNLNASLYANPRSLGGNPEQDKALRNFRTLSAELQAKLSLIPFYRINRFLFGLPKFSNVMTAARELIGLSNGHDHVLENLGILNCYRAQKIKLALGLPIPPDEMLDPEHERKFIKAKS